MQHTRSSVHLTLKKLFGNIFQNKRSCRMKSNVVNKIPCKDCNISYIKTIYSGKINPLFPMMREVSLDAMNKFLYTNFLYTNFYSREILFISLCLKAFFIRTLKFKNAYKCYLKNCWCKNLEKTNILPWESELK